MDGDGHIQFMEGDEGLDYIIPLQIFMHQTLQKAICKYLVKHFKEASYVKENSETPEQSSKTLTAFFEEMNEKGKEMNLKSKQGKQKNKSSQQSQAQQSHPQQTQAQQSHPQQNQPQQNQTEQSQAEQNQPQPAQPQSKPVQLLSISFSSFQVQVESSGHTTNPPRQDTRRSWGGHPRDNHRSRSQCNPSNWKDGQPFSPKHQHQYQKESQRHGYNYRGGSSRSHQSDWCGTNRQGYSDQQLPYSQSGGQDHSGNRSDHCRGSSRSRRSDWCGTNRQGYSDQQLPHLQSGGQHDSAYRSDHRGGSSRSRRSDWCGTNRQGYSDQQSSYSQSGGQDHSGNRSNHHRSTSNSQRGDRHGPNYQGYSDQQSSYSQSGGQHDSVNHSNYHCGSSNSQRGVRRGPNHQNRSNNRPSQSQSGGQDHATNRSNQRSQVNPQQPIQPLHSSQNQQDQRSQSQQGSQGQNPTQTAENPKEPHYDILQNINDNSSILNMVTVGDLIQGNEACQKLLRLDINFLLNTVLKIIGLPLEDAHREALMAIKNARKAVVHARYDFGQEDFNENLSAFEDAAKVLYEHLGINMVELQDHVTVCREDVTKGCKALCILDKLAEKIHRGYSLNSTFVPPHLTFSSQTGGEQEIRDLSQFIKDQKDPQNLILLSGAHREEKTELLRLVASTLKSGSKYKLVLFINERNRRLSRFLACSDDTDGRDDDSPASLQEQVLSCLTHLVPDVVDAYGLDTAKTAIKRCQKDVLFLINWNIDRNHNRSRLGDGTWVFTYEGTKPRMTDWKVLEVKPYTQEQVVTMISKKWLKDFRYRSDLYSLDMIETFQEVCSNGVSMRTDFDLVKEYVEKRWMGQEEDIVRLGQKTLPRVSRPGLNRDVSISEDLWQSFLCPVRGEWRFKHSIVRDFVTAKYVVAEPSEACQRLLQDAGAHKRVFKFSCFLWCNSQRNRYYSNNHCGSSRGEGYLQYVKEFLKKIVHAPEERLGDGSGREGTRGCRNLFSDWDFLLELDDVCDRKVIDCFMAILSDVSCWCFDDDRCQGLQGNMTRLGKVLRKVRVNEEKSRTILMKTSTTTTLIKALWDLMRSVEGLYYKEQNKVFFELDIGPQIPVGEMERFLKAVAETEAPLCIRSYRGPFSCSVFKYFRSNCMKNLKLLKICVSDVPSLKKALECTAKELHIEVNIEQHFEPVSINLPGHVSIYIRMKYSTNSQLLLDAFMGSQNVCLLELIISDISDLSQWKKCPKIRTDVATGRHGHNLPLSSWLSNLPLPSSSLRLLFRLTNVTSRNNSFHYSVKRVVVLNPTNSLTRAVRSSRDEEVNRQEQEEDFGAGSILKRKDSCRKCPSFPKRSRMSTDEPTTTIVAEEVEAVIATDEGICFCCFSLQCECVFMVGQEERNWKQNSLTDLIEHMEKCNIQCTSYPK